jgi:hypothetical protein
MSHRGAAILALLLVLSGLAEDDLAIQLYDPAIQHMVVSSAELPVNITNGPFAFLNLGSPQNVTLLPSGDLVNVTNITEVSIRSKSSVKRMSWFENTTLLLDRDRELRIERMSFNITDPGLWEGGISIHYSNRSFTFPIRIRVEEQRYIAYMATSIRHTADLLEDEPRTMRDAAYSYIEAAKYYRLLLNVANEDYCRRKATGILDRVVAQDSANKTRWNDLRTLAEQYQLLDDTEELSSIQNELIPWYSDKLSADLTYYAPLAQAFTDIGAIDKAERTLQLYAQRLDEVANATEGMRRAEDLEAAARVYERLCDRKRVQERYLAAAEAYRKAIPTSGNVPDNTLALWSFDIAELYKKAGEPVRADQYYLSSLDIILNIIRTRELQHIPLTFKAVRIYGRLENDRAGELLDLLASPYVSANQTWEKDFQVLMGLESVYRWAWESNHTMLVNKTCSLGTTLSTTLGDQYHLSMYTACHPPVPDEVCINLLPLALEVWIDTDVQRLITSLSETSKTRELADALDGGEMVLTTDIIANASVTDRLVLEAIRDVCRQRMSPMLPGPFNASLTTINGSLVCFTQLAETSVNGTRVASPTPGNVTTTARPDPTGKVLKSLLIMVLVIAVVIVLLTYHSPPQEPEPAPRQPSPEKTEIPPPEPPDEDEELEDDDDLNHEHEH